jgi:hypothetical protein
MKKKKAAAQQKGSAQEKVDWKALDIVHPEAADPEPVRRFGCFTADLREMARWLIDQGVRSVAID